MIYACRATPWGESILEEREGETNRANREMSRGKTGDGDGQRERERDAERKRGRVEACTTVSPGKSAASRRDSDNLH